MTINSMTCEFGAEAVVGKRFRVGSHQVEIIDANKSPDGLIFSCLSTQCFEDPKFNKTLCAPIFYNEKQIGHYGEVV